MRGDHRALAPAQQHHRAVLQPRVRLQGAHHAFHVGNAVFGHISLVGGLVNLRIKRRFAAGRAAARAPAEKGRAAARQLLGKEIEIIKNGLFVELAGVVVCVGAGAVDKHHQLLYLAFGQIQLSRKHIAVRRRDFQDFRLAHLFFSRCRAAHKRKQKRRQQKFFHGRFPPVFSKMESLLSVDAV